MNVIQSLHEQLNNNPHVHGENWYKRGDRVALEVLRYPEATVIITYSATGRLRLLIEGTNNLGITSEVTLATKDSIIEVAKFNTLVEKYFVMLNQKLE